MMLSLFAFFNIINVSAENPIKIHTAEELSNIRNDLSGSYILMNDINLFDWGIWEPISLSSGVIFDGGGHTISNLYIPETVAAQFAGLFGNIITNNKIVIKNLKVEIEECVAIGKDGGVATTANGHNSTTSCFAGGIIAMAYGDITIENCYVYGNIEAISTSFAWAGGLIGYSNKNVEINNCGSVGSVSTKSAQNSSAVCGGMVGFGSGPINIQSSYSVMDIIATSNNTTYASMTGGFIGYNDNTTIIANSYACGDVTANSNYNPFSGGLIGFGYKGVEITNCYATGKITGKTTGGLIGYRSSYSITYSYFNKETTGQTQAISGDSSKESAKTTAEMKTQTTYKDWDFVDIWDIAPNENDGYPFLAVTPPYSVLKRTPLGHVSGGDKLSVTDARLVLQHLVGKITLTEEELDLANVSGGDNVSITDARLILQMLVGKIAAFPRKA